MRRHFRAEIALLAATLGLVLGGCSTAPQRPADRPDPVVVAPPASAAPAPDPVRSQIVFTALQMLGTPYRYGGSTPTGFDCSGLVQYAYRSAGLSVPRTTRDQLGATTAVTLADAAPGDLLFFRSKSSAHVGIYLGEGRFVHAPFTGRNVEIGSLDQSWYHDHFVRAGRLQGVATQAASCNGAADGRC
ncbi:MAG: C40 family peptidase [Gammaproteobacteria bacterium]|nr:MAG: C40 family peptidase [Gammaproteobacteria bacterium]